MSAPRGEPASGEPASGELASSAVPARATEPAVRVSTLELFFDLVFVFTITQLTGVLVGDLTLAGLGRVMLMLGVIWWMYGGYAWLTNAVAPTNTIRRGLLITGMGGFLAVALGIPAGYGDTGWVFGLGYFLVNLVHSGLFRLAGGPGAATAMRWLGPLNLLSASLVLAGGFAPGGWRYAGWGAALAVQIVSPYLHPIGGFTISATHFVERHGLVVIVALGESVVAIGAGVGAHPTWRLLAVAVLGLILAYYLWWAYFGGDDERAEVALAAIADPHRRARAALAAYGFAHYPLLLGIVVLAAGVKKAIGHAFDHLQLAQALAVGAGVILFLGGDLAFRAVLKIRGPWYRLGCVAAAALTVPLGLWYAAAQLAVLTLVIAVLLAVEGLRRVRRGG